MPSQNGGQCVETASGNGLVMVRDTTNRDGGALAFGPEAWATFLTSIR
jgi:Domain of unknown function (DUF397)